jgi:hypothetical protein
MAAWRRFSSSSTEIFLSLGWKFTLCFGMDKLIITQSRLDFDGGGTGKLLKMMESGTRSLF